MTARVAPQFDPAAAAQAYFDRHAADCVKLGCKAEDVGVEIALKLIALPIAVLVVAIVLHRLGFWQWSFAFTSRVLRRRFLGAAAFGAMVMAVFVLVRMPFRYYFQVWLGQTGGIQIVNADNDPRFAPPNFAERSISFLWEQAETGLILGLIAAALAPLIIWALGRAPRIVMTLAGLAFFAWSVTPTIEPWRATYEMPAGDLRDDMAEIAARADVSMDRVRLGYKQTLTIGHEEARAEWVDGGTKAVMHEEMLNIFRVVPKIWSPPLTAFTAPEFRAVTGHELAHLQLRHWETLIAWKAAMAALFTALTGWLAWRLAIGCKREDQPEPGARAAFLALFLALGFALTHVIHPLNANFIRMQENAADEAGLDFARDPDGNAEMALRLARNRPIERDRWYHALYITHPDSRTRIERAMRWKAANTPAIYRATGPTGPVRRRYLDEIEIAEDWVFDENE